MPPSRIRLYAANVQATQPRTLDSDTSGSFAQAANRLDPAKTLFDAFADLQAHRIALAPCSTSVDGAAPSVGVPGNVSFDTAPFQRRDEVLRVVPLSAPRVAPRFTPAQVSRSSAPARSPVPLTWRTSTATNKALRFSIRALAR